MAIDAVPAVDSRRNVDSTGGRSGIALLGILVLLSSWEAVGRSNALFTSYPSAVFEAATSSFLTESLIPAFAQTLHGTAIGFGLAVMAGAFVGYLMGASRWAELILEPYVNAIYATPRITIIPLLVLWVGIGFELRVVIVFLSAVFPIIINTHRGAKEVPDLYRDVARFSCATGWQEWRTITFPSSVPYLVAGLKVAILRALTAAIVAEMVAAVTGTGKLLLDSGRFFRTDELFATLIVLGLVGIALTRLVDGLRYLLARSGLA